MPSAIGNVLWECVTLLDDAGIADRYTHFREVTKLIRFAEGVGLPGRVALTGLLQDSVGRPTPLYRARRLEAEAQEEAVGLGEVGRAGHQVVIERSVRDPTAARKRGVEAVR